MARKKILIALSVLVFAFGLGIFAKTQAGVMQGWPWGGSEDGNIGGVINPSGPPYPAPDGNETGVGWINGNCGSIVDSNLNGSIDSGDVALKICAGGVNNDMKSCNGPGAVDCQGAICAPACDVLASKSPAISYGVNIPDSSCTGSACNLSGYVWNENISWISFNSADVTNCPNSTNALCPSGNCCPARRGTGVDANKLLGWARITGIRDAYILATPNSGGWQGWISLSNINCDLNRDSILDTTGTGLVQCSTIASPRMTYGVDTNQMTGSDHTYAWSNELGWVDFGRASISASASLAVCPPTGNLASGAPGHLHAYYSPSSFIDCNNLYSPGTLDVTQTSQWSKSGTSVDIVGYKNDSEGEGERIQASPTVTGDTIINATYLGLTDFSTITVGGTSGLYCGDKIVTPPEQCDGGLSNGPCPQPCSATCINNIGCSDTPWKEVNP
jgi:hypothetical protein